MVTLFDDTLAGADPMTFECLESEYGKDGDHIFFSARMMPEIDAASFEVLGHRGWGLLDHALMEFQYKSHQQDHL